MKVSQMAENLISSEIIKIAADVNEMKRKGKEICNLTIGDFNPEYYPIPDELKSEIINSYNANNTNYPQPNGMLELRESVSEYMKSKGNLDYSSDETLISAGSRPLIFATYMTVIDSGDKIVYPLPSWNNNHYSHITGGTQVAIETKPENNFMPTAAELEPHLQDAVLLALCSPLNPTGTVFSEKDLTDICNLVLGINRSRTEDQKPLYILYDQVYWQLTYGDTKHYDPVSVCPEIKDYTIYIDGMSKAYAATGVRLGWAMGPSHIINKMRAILSHVGAWSPKAEQLAAAVYLKQYEQIDNFMDHFKGKIQKSLHALYTGFSDLKADGFPIDAITPMAAIYLTVKLDLVEAQKPDGTTIASSREVAKYILEESGIALVPFYAFGATEENPWCRLSVGAASLEEIENALPRLRSALEQLTFSKVASEVS